ncbi:hypothetical protein R6Q59_003419 [Mikania micrantha]
MALGRCYIGYSGNKTKAREGIIVLSTSLLVFHASSIRFEGFRSLGDGETVEFVVETGSDGRTKAADVTGPDEGHVQGSSCGSGDRYSGGGGGGDRYDDGGGGGDRYGGGGRGGGR